MRKGKGKETLILLFLALIDRFSKWFAFRNGNVSLNKGVSFGLFSSDSVWPFLIFTLALLCLVITFGRKNCFGTWLILIGGLSNLADRFVFGGVVDFISLPSLPHLPHFPSFNGADLSISLGLFLILVDLVKKKTVS